MASNPWTRYASKDMLALFDDAHKFGLWREMWVAIAKAQMELGLTDDKGKPRITPEQVAELKANVNNIDLERAKVIEKETKHDVMAHIRAYGEVAPSAQGIIHLGCTSRDITDNCELLQIRDAAELVQMKLANALNYTADAAERYKSITVLGLTHLQPAQATTVGRRLAMYGEQFLLALHGLEQTIEGLPLRGIKGTVGTQADQLSLFRGDQEKVQRLEERIAREFGFSKVLEVPGQTYHRMLDYSMAGALGNISVAARRFANDLRISQAREEIEEPFAEKQTGSSAMPWKRNPKNAERMSSLTYLVLAYQSALGEMAANQWFEGSVEDSAMRRIAIPEMFYATDGILDLYIDTINGLNVYQDMIVAHVAEKLPLIATNTFLMEAVKKGGDRQKLHESFREHAQAAVVQYRRGGRMDFLERVANDPQIPLDQGEVSAILDDSRLFIGNAVRQTDRFVQIAKVRLQPYAGKLGYKPKVEV